MCDLVVSKLLLQCCQTFEESSLYLWVGELQTSDREDHLSCSDEEILRNLPGHVHGVTLDVQHWLDTFLALQTQTCTQMCYLKLKSQRLFTQNIFISYLWKCYSRRDDQGVRAAKAQFLSVRALTSTIKDPELCANQEKNNKKLSEEQHFSSRTVFNM